MAKPRVIPESLLKRFEFVKFGSDDLETFVKIDTRKKATNANKNRRPKGR